MKVPEKILITQDEDTKELSEHWCLGNLTNNPHIEYINKDAFIKKACEGIDHLLSGYIIRNFNFGDSYDIDKFIEDFKNYMKGK